jgi:thiopurine S-methyltransferase
MSELNAQYWEERWQQANTPWDIGDVSPPLRLYLDAHTSPDTAILIPGAGNAYEAIYLHQRGYRRVWVCDWAPSAFEGLRAQAPDFPEEHLLTGDFFDLSLKVDLVLEQTFFCAIDPELRERYAQKTHELLLPEGILAGLLFAREFSFAGPPFGGDEAAYRAVFEPWFDILEMAPSPYSIGPRLGNELMMVMRKRPA